MSVLKLSRWRAPFKLVFVLILLLPCWSYPVPRTLRPGFINAVRTHIIQGTEHLFPGHQSLEGHSNFLGESSHGKRKQRILDVKGQEHSLFIKIFYEKTPIAERRRTIETTKALGAVWGYPKLFWHDPRYQVMITEFLEGHHPDQDYFKNPETLKVFMEKLKASHALLPTLPLHFDNKSLRYRSLRRLRELLKVAPDMKERLVKAEKFLDSLKPSFTHVVHGDIQASNIIVGGSVALIDWSEVSHGDVFEDLGSLAEQMDFTAEQEHQMVEAYFGAVTPENLAKLEKYRLLNRLHFGCYLVRQGFKKLERQKARRPKGAYGLYLEPQIQKGMALLKPFLD